MFLKQNLHSVIQVHLFGIPANIEIIGAAEPVFIPGHSYILNIQNNMLVTAEYIPNSN